MIVTAISPQLANASAGAEFTAKESTEPSATGSEKLLGFGADGIARTVVTEDNGQGGVGVLSNELKLQPGDRVEILNGGAFAQVYDASGARLGQFESPTVQMDGNEVKGKFAYRAGNL